MDNLNNTKNANNLNNVNNLNMLDYAKVLEDITKQLEIVKSTISLNYDLLDKIEIHTDDKSNLASYYDLIKTRDDYINLLSDSMDKIFTINMQLRNMQDDMEVQNGE